MALEKKEMEKYLTKTKQIQNNTQQQLQYKLGKLDELSELNENINTYYYYHYLTKTPVISKIFYSIFFFFFFFFFSLWVCKAHLYLLQN